MRGKPCTLQKIYSCIMLVIKHLVFVSDPVFSRDWCIMLLNIFAVHAKIVNFPFVLFKLTSNNIFEL